MTEKANWHTRKVTVYGIFGQLFQVEGREGPEKAAERLYAMWERASEPTDTGPFSGRPHDFAFVGTNEGIAHHPKLRGLTHGLDDDLVELADPNVQTTYYLLNAVETEGPVRGWTLTSEPVIETLTLSAGGRTPHLEGHDTLREFVEQNLPDASNRPALHVIPTGRRSCALVHGNNLEQIEEMIWQEADSQKARPLPFVEKALEEHRARIGTLVTPSR